MTSQLLIAQDFNATRLYSGENDVYDTEIEDVDGDNAEDVIVLGRRFGGFDPDIYEILLFSNMDKIPEEQDSVVLYSSEESIFDLAVFDVNGDGLPDILFGEGENVNLNGDDLHLSFLLNSPDGFQDPPVQTDLIGYGELKPLQLTPDGDIAIVGIKQNELLNILLPLGDLAFSEFTFPVDIVDFPEEFQIGDIDNDGNSDIVVAHTIVGIGYLTALYNGGDGNFTDETLLFSQSRFNSIQLLDYNNDDLIDIVGLDSPELTFLENDGEGIFTEVLQARVEGLTFFGGRRLELADLDGDNTDEIIIGVNEDVNLWIDIISTDPVEIVSNEIGVGSQAFNLTAGDIDSDGDEDVIITTGTFRIFENVIDQITTPTIEISLIENAYPNPADSYIFIDEFNNGLTSYAIYNLSGLQVRQGKLFNNRIDVSELVSGQYTVVLLSESKLEKQVIRIVKM